MRLPSGFNGDAGMYYLNSAWRIKMSELYVIHYTPFKPWVWYTYPLFDLSWKWNAVRDRLPTHYNESSLTSLDSVLPLVVIPLLILLVFSKTKLLSNSISLKISSLLAALLHRVKGVYPLLSLIGAYTLSFLLVPAFIPPMQGFLLFGVWMVIWLLTFYAAFSHYRYHKTALTHDFSVTSEATGQRDMPEPVYYISKQKHFGKTQIRVECFLWLAAYIVCFHFVRLVVLLHTPKFNIRLKYFLCFEVFELVYAYYAGRRILDLC